MVQIRAGLLEWDEFAARCEKLWNDLGCPGPRESWITWLADQLGRSSACIYLWRSEGRPPPVYAQAFLREQERKLGRATSMTPEEVDGLLQRSRRLEREVAELRAFRARVESERRLGVGVSRAFAELGRFEGAIRSGIAALGWLARERGRKGEVVGASEAREAEEDLRRALRAFQQAEKRHRGAQATASQRLAAAVGTAKAVGNGRGA